MKNLIYIMFFSLAFTSCVSFFETTLELEEPVFEEQLNVNGIIQSLIEDQKILVSKTVGLNEHIDSSLVNGADVNIIYPDGSNCNFENLINEYGFSGQNYFGTCSDFKAEEVYQLRVVVPDKDMMATATARMPMTVSFSDILYLEEGGLNDDGNEVSAVDLIINDPSGVENYYKFLLYRKNENYINEFNIESNDALIIESAIYSAVLLSDNQFDGENYKLRLLFRDYYSGGGLEDIELFLVASTISKDQYLFDKKLRQFEDNNDNPFASSTQLHDNIDGGLGIFAIENTQVIQVN